MLLSQVIEEQRLGGGFPEKEKDLVSFTNLTKIAYHFEIFCGYTSYF